MVRNSVLSGLVLCSMTRVRCASQALSARRKAAKEERTNNISQVNQTIQDIKKSVKELDRLNVASQVLKLQEKIEQNLPSDGLLDRAHNLCQSSEKLNSTDAEGKAQLIQLANYVLYLAKTKGKDGAYEYKVASIKAAEIISCCMREKKTELITPKNNENFNRARVYARDLVKNSKGNEFHAHKRYSDKDVKGLPQLSPEDMKCFSFDRKTEVHAYKNQSFCDEKTFKFQKGTSKDLYDALDKQFESIDKGMTEHEKAALSKIKLTSLSVEEADLAFELGKSYLSDTPKNEEKAVAWFQEAAYKGNADAQCKLGYMYKEGQGVKQDYKEAVRLYQLSSEKKHKIAQNNLGSMYQHGKGVKQNDEEAAKYYQEAANKEDAIAENNLGFMYQYGKGVEQNDATALYWYTKAANQEDAGAENNLGKMYQLGKGVKKDDATAVIWYKKAADQEHARAQYNLGLMYQHGKGVKKNYATAVILYKKAQENAEAQKDPEIAAKAKAKVKAVTKAEAKAKAAAAAAAIAAQKNQTQ
eukprot:COSAG01_NODE_6_length_54687_cov_500.907599_22_plen_528_part_00